jgi:CopG family nickel-responsive transcriptional regulator
MSDVVRFTVSLERGLFDRLNALVEASEYRNRSEFVRDLIRGRIVDEEWRTDEVLLGTISLLYDHHRHGLTDRLTHEQHHFAGEVLATTHVHLDERLCAEMIMVRGRGADIHALAERLHREKGVLHARVATGSTGGQLR